MNNDESLKVDPQRVAPFFCHFQVDRMLEFKVSKEYGRMWRTLAKAIELSKFFYPDPRPWLKCSLFCLRHFFHNFFTRPLPISLLVETVTGVLSSTIQGVQILVVDGWDTDKMSAAWQCPIIPTMWWLEEMEDWCGYGICARISVFEQSKRTAHVLRCGSVLLHSNEFWFNFSHNLKVNIDNFQFEIYTGSCLVSLEK